MYEMYNLLAYALLVAYIKALTAWPLSSPHQVQLKCRYDRLICTLLCGPWFIRAYRSGILPITADVALCYRKRALHFLYRELKHNILASQLLVHALEGLNLPLCAVPVLGVQVHLHHAHTVQICPSKIDVLPFNENLLLRMP